VSARSRFPAKKTACAPLALLAAAFLACASAQAAPADAPRGADRLEQLDPATVAFVLGNVQFVLLHELAHLVIHEKDVPIIGPEETAADYIAATVLILGEQLDDDAKDRAIRSLLAAAEAFSLSWQMGSELGSQVRYWGAHALSIQRYHQIICLLYGSNPEVFNDLPGRVGMPNVRKLDCSTEFARAARSTQWLLNQYGRQEGDPAGAEIGVSYAATDTLVTSRLLDEVQKASVLENTIRRFSERFTLDRPMTVVARHCRQPESAWVPESRELVICHELLEGLYQLSLRRDSAVALGTGRIGD
jgi:hypothetical protein